MQKSNHESCLSQQNIQMKPRSTTSPSLSPYTSANGLTGRQGMEGSRSFLTAALPLSNQNMGRCYANGSTHLIFFKITSLSISTPFPVVLPRLVARLEVLNWDLFQSIRHGSLHVFNSTKMVSFQLGIEPGKQKEIGCVQVWA